MKWDDRFVIGKKKENVSESVHLVYPWLLIPLFKEHFLVLSIDTSYSFHVELLQNTLFTNFRILISQSLYELVNFKYLVSSSRYD